MFASSFFTLALAGFAAAAPAFKNATVKFAADCNVPVGGLTVEDCQHMNNIGMAGMGDNIFGNNGYIWIGDDGPNTFTFTNAAAQALPMTLILWDNPVGDYQSSFMNVRTPKISYSLTNVGDSVTISLANGISGGWATLNNHVTTLSQYGQIFNTWGEFTTGDYATVDVSREVNMGGNIQSIQVSTGCVADMNLCSFQCNNGQNSCGESGTYNLLGCTPDVNPNSSTGTYDGINPEGGCMGWANGGHLDVTLGSY